MPVWYKRSLAVAVLAATLVLSGCGGGTSGTADEAGAGDEGRFQGMELRAPVPKPDFTLTDTQGNSFDFRAETEGVTTLLFFGYTSCPDICPVHLAQIAAVLEEPSAPASVTMVFVSVDPERDTPEAIRAYLDRFSTSFIGLTGSEEELVSAQEAAGLRPAFKEETDDPGQYYVGHAAQVLAFAPNGLGYTIYPYGTRQSTFAHDLAILDGLRTLDDQP